MLPRLFFFLSFLLLLTLSSGAFAATYYVDFENGKDSNDGLSRDTAWRTLPGTKAGSGTGRPLRTSWGSGTTAVSRSTRISAGDTILLRSGTTYNLSLGGCIYVTSGSDGFYVNDATAANPITITVDPSWGNGRPVVFDGSGSTWTPDDTAAFLLIQGVSGVVIDGKVAGGIVITNSGVGGIRVRAVTSRVNPQHEGYTFRNIGFVGNGANVTTGVRCPRAKGSCLLYAASEADIMLKDTSNVTIERCMFDGTLPTGGVSNINGLMIGDYDNRNLNVSVIDCVARNHSKDVSADDDHGIGFKANNGQVTFTRCASYHNNKGFDLTDHCSQDGCQLPPGIIFKVIGAEVYGNRYGVNFVNSGTAAPPPSPGPYGAYFYLVNSVVRDNTEQGSNIYSGPYDVCIVHNVYDHNGTSGLYEAGHVAITNDYDSGRRAKDLYSVRAYLYNNIFYNQGVSPSTYPSSAFVQDWWWLTGSDFNWDSDYNLFYVNSRGKGLFARWGALNGSSPASERVTYEYGSKDGPGWSTSRWYREYGGTTTRPSVAGCTGHHGSDSHSKGTGAADPSLPAFADYATHNYHLQAPLKGLDISSKPWFIPEMAYDRDGRARMTWDMGPYEHNLAAHSR